MAKLMECPSCGCIMECVHWYVNDEPGGSPGTGDFECRNCDHIANNEKQRVERVDGYIDEVLADVPLDKEFKEFMGETHQQE